MMGTTMRRRTCESALTLADLLTSISLPRVAPTTMTGRAVQCSGGERRGLQPRHEQHLTPSIGRAERQQHLSTGQ